MSADRNLLFGILALQMDFVCKEDLIAAMHAWVLAKQRPLADLLIDRGCLRPDHRALLDALVQAQLDHHGGDARQSLAALSPLGPVRADLDGIADTDVRASLGAVAAAHDEETHDPNRTWSLPSVGQATSGGHRFRVLRPYAEGGLGRVSVAQDEELHREVALKEILSRYADDPESRARFLLEAEVTGGLEHPGVVPVYGLGHYADGRPFYAMRFIRGDSLKDAIDRFHGNPPEPRAPGSVPSTIPLASVRGSFDSLEFRGLLGRFVDVCNAIAYAHSRRVLHRDLKPGNIVLGKYGETLVIDWGLAKPLDAVRAGPSEPATEPPLQPASASGTGETLPGSAVGTPGYMSPEQAAGRWDVVGPASDIFSLGATLYAVLTGRPPFAGDDVADVLHCVERNDFPPPRAVVPSVPAALAAVCQKAMALNPADRYGSALALAGDIEHWLADEPVTALREPWHAWVRRWGRRHRPIVAGAATLLVMAVVLLVGLYVQAERARSDVAAERDRAVAARNQTRQALDAMLSEKSIGWLETQKELLPQQRAFLERVLDFYEQFAAEPGEDVLARKRLADAHFRVASLQARLGRFDAADATARRTVALVERLAADAPDVVEHRQDLGRVHYNLGILLANRGRRAEAEAEYRSALTAYEKLAAEFPTDPDYRRSVARTCNNLGVVFDELGRREEAEAMFRKSVRVREELAAALPTVRSYQQELARATVNLGAFLAERGLGDKAEAAYRAALPVQEKLAADAPAVAEYRRDLARTQVNLGHLLDDQDRRAEAESAYRAALAAREKLAADYPLIPAYRQESARSYHTLGELLDSRGGHRGWVARPAEAEAALRAALAIREKLAADAPAVPQYRQELADSSASLGDCLAARGKRAEAEETYRRALAVREKLAAEAPAVPVYRVDVARLCTCFGHLYSDGGDPAIGLPWYDRAVDGLTAVLKQQPNEVSTRQALRRALAGRARALGKLGRHADAVRSWDQALKADVSPASAEFRLDRATALARAGDPAAAATEADAVAAGADAAVLVGAASVHAVVAGGADSRLADRSAARTVVLLRQTVAGGVSDLASVLTDKDFNSVRGRADFVEFLWDAADMPAVPAKP